jgi:hypothetical protein
MLLLREHETSSARNFAFIPNSPKRSPALRLERTAGPGLFISSLKGRPRQRQNNFALGGRCIFDAGLAGKFGSAKEVAEKPGAAGSPRHPGVELIELMAV